MASNEYEDILSSTPQAPVNEYDSAIQADKSVQKSQLQQNMYQAAQTEPDRRAQVLQLADEMKMPANLVERNFDDIKKRKTFDKMDYDGLIESNPQVAKFLEDPDNAKVAHDDLDNLKQQEQHVAGAKVAQSYYDDFTAGLESSSAGMLIRGKLPDLTLPENAPIADSLAEQAGAILGDFPAMIAGGIVGGAVGSGVGAAAGGAVGTAVGPIGTLGGIATGATVGAAAGSSAGGFAAPAMIKTWLKEEFTNGRVKSLPELFDRLEKVGIEGIKQAGVGLATAGAGGIAGKVVGKVASPILKKAIPYLTEVGSMTVAGKAVEGQDVHARDFLEGGLLVAAMHGVSHAAGSARAKIGEHIDAAANERHAQVLRDFYLSMENTTEASKLRERLPTAHQEFVKQITKDGPVENIFIPAEALDTYFQSKKIDTTAAMQEIGSLPSYQEAKLRGGDVKIPLHDWVNKVVGTEHYKGLADDIRFSPDGFSVNEAKAVREQLVGADQAAQDNVDQAHLAHLDTEASAHIEDTVSSQLKTVAEQMRERGHAFNIDDKQIAQWSKVAARRYIARGRSLGVDPLELFKKDAAPFQAMSDQAATSGQTLEQQPREGLNQVVVGNPDGSMTTAPGGEKQNASARIVGNNLEIQSFRHDEKQPGVSQDMVRSLIEAGKTKGAETVSHVTKDPAIQKVFEAEHFKSSPQPDGTVRLSREVTPSAEHFGFDSKTQSELRQHFDAPDAAKKYSELPGTMGGKLLDPDIARHLVPEYAKDRNGRMLLTHALDIPSTEFVKRQYEHWLEATKGEPGEVLIMSGGSASGKSSVVREYKTALEKNASIILDTTSSNQEATRQMIDAATAAGKKVTFVHVHRKFENAVKANQARFSHPETGGRLVDPEYQAKTHVYSKETYLNLEVHYRNEPDVRFRAYETTEGGGPSKPINVEKVRSLRYIKGSEKPDQAVARLAREKANEQLKGQVDEVQRAKEAALASREIAKPDTRGNGSASQDQSSAQNKNGADSLKKSFDQEGARGRIHITPLQRIIELGPKADFSTLVHESGHAWLDESAHDYAHLLSIDPASRTLEQTRLLDSADKILNWLGVKSFNDIQVEHHEKFARGLERYFMEGKAPTPELRSAFATFKVWMINLYKHVRNLKVELSPEIRDVMGRMIATDEEMSRAEQEQNVTPLFGANPETLGLTGDKALRYQKAVENAKEGSRQALLSKFMDHFQQQREAFYKEQRASNRERIEADVNQMPVYKALDTIQKGKLPDGSDGNFKLSKEILKAQFDEDLVKRLPRGLSIKESDGVMGLHPDEAAEYFGFQNGAELLTALADAEKKTDLVERLTDQHMAEAYPDLINDPAGVHKQALDALHNEPRAKLLRMELEHLASNELPTLKDVVRQSVRRVPPEAEVKKQAADLIQGKRVGEVKPHLYLRAEREAAREAADALTKGDLDAAFMAKRKELLNHELYKSALEANKVVEKTLEKAKKFFQPDEKLSKSRDMDLVNAGRAVLSYFGLGKRSKDAQSYIEPIKQYDPAMYETIFNLANSAIDGKGDYKSVTQGEFEELAHTVKALWDLSKSSKQVEIDGKKIDRDVVQQELQGRLLELTKPGNKAGYEKAVTGWDKFKVGLLGLKSSLTRVEHWADAMDIGDPKGPFRKYIWQPVSEAVDNYRIEQTKMLKRYLTEVLEPVSKSLDSKKIISKELGYTFNGKQELLGALLHRGNLSNFRKLLLGRKWGEINEDGTLNTARWDKFIDRMHSEGVLTKADYDYAQGVWRLNEELKPGAQKAHKQILGYYFDTITADKFQTPFGEYEGGYMPAIVDHFMSADAAIRNDKNALENNVAGAFPTTGKGFTKARESMYNAPLSIDLRMVPAHFDKVLRFSHIEPRIKEVTAIVMDRNFRTALEAHDPTLASDMLVPWLQRTAQQRMTKPMEGAGGKAIDAVCSTLRRRTGLSAMVGNFTNAVQQLTGFSVALTKVEARHLRDGLVTYISSPRRSGEEIASKSKFMEAKLSGQLHELQHSIDEYILHPNKFEQARDFTIRHGYIFQQAAQNIVDISVWTGAYNQALERGVMEHEAVREADSAIRLTQDAQTPESVARFESGTHFARLFSQYAGYFNNIANLGGSEAIKTLRQELGLKKSAQKLLFTYTSMFLVPAILNELIVQQMAGKPFDENDDGKYLDDVLKLFFGSQFRFATAMLPGVGPVANSAVSRFNNKAYDDRLSTSPALSAVENTVTGITFQEARKKHVNADRVIRDSLTAISMFTGVPVAPLAKPISYYNDYKSGKAKPTGAVDFTRGLITGKPGGKN